jgi:hypothetical protein
MKREERHTSKLENKMITKQDDSQTAEHYEQSFLSRRLNRHQYKQYFFGLPLKKDYFKYTFLFN